MAERAEVFEAFQLGLEATIGGGASAYYRLLASEATLDAVLQHNNHKPKTSKFVTFQSKGQEYSKGNIQGATSIYDLLFMLNGLVQGVISTPTHNNVFSVTLGGATGGTHIFTFGGVSTATIAFGANAAAVKAALAAISTIGNTNNVTVTGVGSNADPFIITLLGDLANGGALTWSGAALTGATSPALTTTAGGTVRRWTHTMSPFAADTPQTYKIQKGNAATANAAESAIMMFIQSLNIKMTLQDCTFSSDFFAQKIVQPDTMATGGSVTDLPLAPIEPRCVNVYLGKSLSGLTNRPDLLTRVFDTELSIGPKWNPLRTLNCNIDGIAAGVEVQPNSTVMFALENNGDAQGVINNSRNGDLLYLIIDAIGGPIPTNTAYNYRVRAVVPFFISDISRDNMEGVYTAKVSGDISYSTVLSKSIVFQVDTDHDTF